ncbi:heme-binding domain-containing protein [Chitinophaga deserti]|uniref:heme-binding domain-containing protein n=1 Tax=Chitinophaga deserti TaxID=2164099 RepID=UPI000D6D21F6|nr:heme-binding domain-containing protein [Chitinophaga deserti]
MTWKRILVGLLILFVIIQFFRPQRNLSAAVSDNDISRKYPIPENVQTILQRSCNDCHSNNTQYPWYANVQPVAWWMDKHVRDGKRKLNFSEFLSYPLKRQDHKLEETTEQLEDHEMPLWSYLITHGDARLDEAQIRILTNWANSLRPGIQAEMFHEAQASM